MFSKQPWRLTLSIIVTPFILHPVWAQDAEDDSQEEITVPIVVRSGRTRGSTGQEHLQGRDDSKDAERSRPPIGFAASQSGGGLFT